MLTGQGSPPAALGGGPIAAEGAVEALASGGAAVELSLQALPAAGQGRGGHCQHNPLEQQQPRPTLVHPR